MNESNVNSSGVTTLFVGFGPAAEAAAHFLLRSGQPAPSFMVLPAHRSDCDRAESIGLACATDGLGAVKRFGAGASRIIVDLRDDRLAEQAVRCARACAPGAVIVVNTRHPRSVARMVEIGASRAFCEGALAGVHLAETIAPSSSPGLRMH